MKIYLAHNFVARDYLRTEVIPQFEAAGHEITSTWITDDSHIHEMNAEQSAITDLQDIDRAQVIVLFSDQFSGSRSQGKGKFFEFGYALARNKRMFLCGRDMDSCVFYAIPTIHKLLNIQDLLATLAFYS